MLESETYLLEYKTEDDPETVEIEFDADNSY